MTYEGQRTQLKDEVEDDAAIARGVVLFTKDPTYVRRVDHALWFLNTIQRPLTFDELEDTQFKVLDIITDSNGSAGSERLNDGNLGASGRPSANNISGNSGGGGIWNSSSNNRSNHLDKLSNTQAHNLSSHGISLLTENLDRKYKFTEKTVFWTTSEEYKAVFVIDISQSMYTLDPNTNIPHIEVALETIEKCIMGMVQPFVIRSSLGFPDHTIEPNICTSVIGYCPRPPGSYPIEKGREKLPFCRTLAHAHMLDRYNVPEFIDTIRNFLYNYECELQDSLGSFPPPPPPIPLSSLFTNDGDSTPGSTSESQPKRMPRAGDEYSLEYDPEVPLLHVLQIADYFLKLLPEYCSPVFVYLTDGVVRSNLSVSRIQSVTSNLTRLNTQCTFVLMGSSGGFTPETPLGFVSDSEQLLYLAASLGGSFIYAADCPNIVIPGKVNFYHQVFLIKENRLARTLVRHRFDYVQAGALRITDMPRERLNMNTANNLRFLHNNSNKFPWSHDDRPPVVDNVTARFTDYNMSASMNMIIEARMQEGFVLKGIQTSRSERDGIIERINVKMELVWHPNITVVYHITNTHYARQTSTTIVPTINDRTPTITGTHTLPRLRSATRSSSESSDSINMLDDRGKRSPNMVDIMIRSYSMFAFAFLHPLQDKARKSDIYAKAQQLHSFLEMITLKDDIMRQLFTLPSGIIPGRTRNPTISFTPSSPQITFEVPETESQMSLYVPRISEEKWSKSTRVYPDEIDTNEFLPYTEWTAQHYHIHDITLKGIKSGGPVLSLSGFTYVSSVYIEPDLISPYIQGMNFLRAAEQGRNILNDFRLHMCRFGAWALLGEETTAMVFIKDNFRLSQQAPAFIVVKWEMATSWVMRVTFRLFNSTVWARRLVMDCLPTFAESFVSPFPDISEIAVRATRPMHLLPINDEISERIPRGLLSTRNMGDLHAYVVEWRWTYLAREGKKEDLSGEGSDREIVRQALHRLASAVGFNRIAQDFSVINAKGESTGLLNGNDSSKYDSCVTYYREHEGLDNEPLLIACQYQVIVDMKSSSVSALTWIEPWSSRFIRTMFEDDFKMLAPLGTFQQILQPQRCFQLKVPNIAEFHSKRMNMFSPFAVANSSRFALRTLQLPNISPGYAVWNQPNGTESIELDDPTVINEPAYDPDDDLEVEILDENGKIVSTLKAAEYYKTTTPERAKQLCDEKKIRLIKRGPGNERRAILLERFMLTLFDSDDGKYDPHIEKYRHNEYNPFVLALIRKGHTRGLFFNDFSAKWITTGEFSIVAYRCFLEFALFKRCDAISVNAERFAKLQFSKRIVNELSKFNPEASVATGVPNSLEEHLYLDKWYIIRLPNKSSFLMIMLPNITLSLPEQNTVNSSSPNTNPDSENGSPGVGSDKEHNNPVIVPIVGSNTLKGTKSTEIPYDARKSRRGSETAAAPVFTPALNSSITGEPVEDLDAHNPLNVYTLAMECSMESTEMRRHVRALEIRALQETRNGLNLKPFYLNSEDTMVYGQSYQGFIGQDDAQITFSEDALKEIKKLECMYSEAYIQTIYLALLMKRKISPEDMLLSQQSTLLRKRSIDVDITAFLHSQDAAGRSREKEWQAQDRTKLQTKFSDLILQSFTALPLDVDPSQGIHYYCKPSPDKRSELEICLQLAQNPLFINLQCSVEVIENNKLSRQLNMPIDKLPLSLNKLCEKAGISWRPPTDHFEPSMNVRVILHINCLYLPNRLQDKSTSNNSEPSKAEDKSSIKSDTPLHAKPDEQELENQTSRLFRYTLSQSSLVSNTHDSNTTVDENKERINTQLATLDGLPQDQLDLVRNCHGKILRFIAHETLYALRDIDIVTLPQLKQVWHTISTTADEGTSPSVIEFSRLTLDLKFLLPQNDMAKRRHGMGLFMKELLKQDHSGKDCPIGKLHELGGIVYMRDIRSRSDRIKARERLKAHLHSDASILDKDNTTDSTSDQNANASLAISTNLSDAMPSWFLVKPTKTLDGVQILTHNYSIFTGEVANNILAANRQLIMVAERSTNTRLLLEELADTHIFPEPLWPGSSMPEEYNIPRSVRSIKKAHPQHYFGTAPATPAHFGHHFGTKTALTTPNPSADAGSNPFSETAPVSPTSKDAFDIASRLEEYIPQNQRFLLCSEQFVTEFQLHPRINPKQAIQTVLASGMMNNRVENRENMFFVRDGSSIFYARLTESKIPFTDPFEQPNTEEIGSTDKTECLGPSIICESATESNPALPRYTPERIMRGAHTIATTSPDPSMHSSHPGGSHQQLNFRRYGLPSMFSNDVNTLQVKYENTAAANANTFICRRSPLGNAVLSSRIGSRAETQLVNPIEPMSASIPGTDTPLKHQSETISRRPTPRPAGDHPANSSPAPGTPDSSSNQILSSLTHIESPGPHRATNSEPHARSPSTIHWNPDTLAPSVVFDRPPILNKTKTWSENHESLKPPPHEAAANRSEADMNSEIIAPQPMREPPAMHHRLTHTVSVASASAFSSWGLGDGAATSYTEERHVPCLVLHIYGVDEPRKEMIHVLVQQINERITSHVIMPNVSDMLHRGVSLSIHDMNFLFPVSNPEPMILYLPLPKFAQSLDRLILHFRQALGDIIPQFPSSDLLPKALRRTFAHIQHKHDNPHDTEDMANEEDSRISNNGIKNDKYRIPHKLQKDLLHILEDWDLLNEPPNRIPFESLVFLYNFIAKKGPPSQAMSDIGSGVAIVSAIPLSNNRTVVKGTWRNKLQTLVSSVGATPGSYAQSTTSKVTGLGLSSYTQGQDGLYGRSPINRHRDHRQGLLHKRTSSHLNINTATATVEPAAGSSSGTSYGISTQSHGTPSSPDPFTQRMLQRRVSHTPSPLVHSRPSSPEVITNHPSSIPDISRALSLGDVYDKNYVPPLPISELSGVFEEYLKQFKSARANLNLDVSAYKDLEHVMENQVDKFNGESVLMITMWRNTNIRLDHLATFVSRAYWSALGDYVSECILYPIISAGWNVVSSPRISLPDPYHSSNDYGSETSNSNCTDSGPRTINFWLKMPESKNCKLMNAYSTTSAQKDTHSAHQELDKFTRSTIRIGQAAQDSRLLMQYWGKDDTVKSIKYYRQRLPTIADISSWFSQEVKGIIETSCEEMKVTTFNVLENPTLMKTQGQDYVFGAQIPLYPAVTLRRTSSTNDEHIIYNATALPAALRDTRKSYCVLASLPLNPSSLKNKPISGVDIKPRAGPSQSLTGAVYRGASSVYSRKLNREYNTQLHRRQGNGRTWNNHTINPLTYGSSRKSAISTEHHLPANLSNRVLKSRMRGSEPAVMQKKALTPIDYKPIEDPKPLTISVNRVPFYVVQGNVPHVSTVAWIAVWLSGDEIEIVGYNVSSDFWDPLCCQIKQRLEREFRRKKMLGLLSSHMSGIFPGYDQSAFTKGMTSIWLDRNVTRDIINRFADPNHLPIDDQLHYFNIDRLLSPHYIRELDLNDNSPALMRLIESPPVPGMTPNDMKMEVVLSSLQPEHLRWARKLTFVDYTQPYVDTHHPDTLFRMGTRFIRAYQSRIFQVIRYDELMRIAEKWQKVVAIHNESSPSNASASRSNIQDLLADGSYHSRAESTSTKHAPQNSGTEAPQTLKLAKPDTNKADSAAEVNTHASIERAASKKGSDDDNVSAQQGHCDAEADKIELNEIAMIMDNARLLHSVCAPLPITRAMKPLTVDYVGFKHVFGVISALLQSLADSYIEYMCSTGYIVAKRGIKNMAWKDALKALGYNSDRIASYTSLAISTAKAGHNGESITAANLPSISVPSAYLFANTERSNLVTDVEISPSMVSIRMYALSRFTSKWKSAVPGYIRSSINPNSIKRFTFELSKFRKLLHIKSFAYDFQLRYVARLLRPLSTALSEVRQKGQTLRTENEGTLNSSDEQISSDNESLATSEEAIKIERTRDNANGIPPLSGSPIGHSVAQELRVHIDLMLFFSLLSEQRYFSTRFSSRRLVRARFPVKHRDLFEYLLDHSEKYHFYTSGCRPQAQRSLGTQKDEHLSACCHNDRLGTIGHKIGCIGYTCSGCYRLYEGVNAEMQRAQFGGLFSPFGNMQEPGSNGWPHMPLIPSPQYNHGTGGISTNLNSIAASAPEPKWNVSRQLSANTGHEKAPGNRAVFHSRRGSALNGEGGVPSMIPGSQQSRVSEYSAEKPGVLNRAAVPASYAPASQWMASTGAGGIGIHRGTKDRKPGRPYRKYGEADHRRMHTQFPSSANPTVPPPSPKHLFPQTDQRSLSGVGSLSHTQHSRPFSDNNNSVLARSLDYAFNEYSMCKVHLKQEDTNANVSLLALIPDCDGCREDRKAAEIQSKERRRRSSQNAVGDGAKNEVRSNQPHNNQNRHHHHHHHHKRRKGHQRTSRSSKYIDDLFINDIETVPRYRLNYFAGAGATDIRHGKASEGNAQHHYRHHSHIQTQGSSDLTPLHKWMCSLAHEDSICLPRIEPEDTESREYAPDPNNSIQQCTSSHNQNEPALLSCYVIVDMDPQTTACLARLQESDSNESKTSLQHSVSQDTDADAPLNAGFGRKHIHKCLSHKDCSTCKALELTCVDMRDWENKGTYWANSPMIVVDAMATMDPDECEKEDPGIIEWLKDTCTRILKKVFSDYRCDLNWYRAYHHIRMASLPRNLEPADIHELIKFLESVDSIDIGATDSRVQQLLGNGLPTNHVIESIQIRLRRLYTHPIVALSLAANTVLPGITGPDGQPDQRKVNAPRHGTAMSAKISAETPPATPTSDTPLNLSRYSTIEAAASGAHSHDTALLEHSKQLEFSLVDLVHGKPFAVIDWRGRILHDKSMGSIDEVLRLLTPLSKNPSDKVRMDPALHKTLSYYARFKVASRPWSCGSHSGPELAPTYTWVLEEVASSNAADKASIKEKPSEAIDSVAKPNTHTHWLAQEGSGAGGSSLLSARGSTRGRRGTSIMSQAMSTVSNLAHHSSLATAAVSETLGYRRSSSIPGGKAVAHHTSAINSSESLALNTASGAPANSVNTPTQQSISSTLKRHDKNKPTKLTKPQVESTPGSLLVVDPEDSAFPAKMFVLNPFTYHGIIELLFARSNDGETIELRHIRAISHTRNHDGLYEYERKHANLILSTISAAVWDSMTR